jgi:tetratricopeptide (TPR) repeat protein
MTAAAARVAIAAAVAVALASGAAHADDNKVKAIALFDEGQKAMKAGNYTKACKAFEASNRLVVDSGTRGSLARCYTKLGRLASAWTVWRELADTAPTPELRTDAAAQAKKLERRLPKYTVKVSAPAAGLAVTVAGQAIDPSLDVPVPIDPGTYAVEATAPGRVAWQGELVAAEGKTAEIAVPELAAAASAEPPPKPPRRPGTPGRGRRILGVALTGVGVGGLAAGGVFGMIARSRYDEAKVICRGDIDRCEPSGVPDAQAKIDDARAAANISTVAFIAGGAMVATGLILYITAPKAERRAVSIAPLVDATTAGIALSGRY